MRRCLWFVVGVCGDFAKSANDYGIIEPIKQIVMRFFAESGLCLKRRC